MCEVPSLLSIHSSIQVRMFADDIKIYCIHKADDPDIILNLQNAIDLFLKWCEDWDLNIAPSKCFCLYLGKVNKRSPYFISSQAITSIDKIRDLGVIFDEKLNFIPHIDSIVSRATSKVFLLFRSLSVRSPDVYITVFKTYILPIIEFSSSVWCPYLKKSINKIENIQRLFTRMLFYRCSYPRDSLSVDHTIPSYCSRLNLYNLSPLIARRAIIDLCCLYKIIRGTSRLRPSKYVRWRLTFGRRNRFQLATHFTRSSLLSNSFFHRTVRWYHLLPDDVITAPSGASFKSRLEKLNLVELLHLHLR